MKIVAKNFKEYFLGKKERNQEKKQEESYIEGYTTTIRNILNARDNNILYYTRDLTNSFVGKKVRIKNKDNVVIKEFMVDNISSTVSYNKETGRFDLHTKFHSGNNIYTLGENETVSTLNKRIINEKDPYGEENWEK
jgi:hypothetical protein